MSMLTAPTRRDILAAGEIPAMAGLLPLSSIVPPTGQFSAPPNWPPAANKMYRYLGHGHPATGLGQPVGTSFFGAPRRRRRRRRVRRGPPQGTWMAPGQVVARQRMSDRAILNAPERFTLNGFGADVTQGTWLSPSQVLPRYMETPKQLLEHSERFVLGGLGCRATQGTWLAPQQLPQSEVESAGKLVNQNLTGMGQAYVDPTQFIQPGQAKKTVLPSFYKDPNIQLKTAWKQARIQLPAFYKHPTLGPWGVDPMQAYNYWRGQQQAMQQQVYMTPMSVWGSPGVNVAPVQPFQGRTLAQAAAFNPYSGTFPIPGTAVEHF